MAQPQDPFLLDGPLPPARPRDPYAESVLDEHERGKDDVRGAAVDSLMAEPARPLTDDERDATGRDEPRPGRTYAPASERVAKPPAPGDERLVEQARTAPLADETGEAGGPGEHAGDRSDPSELR